MTEVDSNASARRVQQQITQQRNQATQGAGDASATRASGTNDSTRTTAQRSEALAAATASNDARGAAGRALIGNDANASRNRAGNEPAMPSAGSGSVADVYREAGAKVPEARQSNNNAGNAGDGTGAPAGVSGDMQARFRPSGAGRANRAGRRRGVGDGDGGEGPEQPRTAGEALSEARDQPEAVRNLARRAGVPVTGRPMSQTNINYRARTISESLMRGEEPPPFGNPPRKVHVSPEERRILQGNDQAARQRVANEVGRREAMRDSLVQTYGTEGAAAVERAYEQMSEQERQQAVPQKDREGTAERLSRIGWAIAPEPLRRLGQLLKTAFGGSGAKKGKGKGGGKTKGPRKSKPRTEEQKARRRELDRQRALERKRAKEQPPPPPPSTPTQPPSTPAATPR